MARLNGKELNKFRYTMPQYKGIVRKGSSSSSINPADIPVGTIIGISQNDIPPNASISIEFTGLESGIDSIHVYCAPGIGDFEIEGFIEPGGSYTSPDDREEGVNYQYMLRGVLNGVEGGNSNTMDLTIFGE